jgi:hypothetical protein
VQQVLLAALSIKQKAIKDKFLSFISPKNLLWK